MVGVSVGINLRDTPHLVSSSVRAVLDNVGTVGSAVVFNIGNHTGVIRSQEEIVYTVSTGVGD